MKISKRKIAYGILSLSTLWGCGGNFTQRGSLQASQITEGQPQATSDIEIPASTADRTPGTMHTNHLIKRQPLGTVLPMAATYYGVPQIRSAYGVPASAGAGTIVVVIAYHNDTALQDFNQFAAQFGLPQENSTNPTASTNKVFQVVYTNGSKPASNAGWGQEASLDIKWSHAMAPNAKIVLIECASNSSADLYKGDDLAASISGVRQCSNSWGGSEYSGETTQDSHFNHTGVTYFFSSGDTGGARSYPAASPNVVAVGGTSLSLNGNVYVSERAWSGAGCGPSLYEPKPSFQSALSAPGTKRGIADISAVADPNTGVLVRWNSGWYIFGGTSVACPIIAGIANASGTSQTGALALNARFYSKVGTAAFHDVKSGLAGTFSAGAGWDYPTGVGSPSGLTAF